MPKKTKTIKFNWTKNLCSGCFLDRKVLFQVWEQMLRDQVRMTSKKGWLSQLQLEKIRRLAESDENSVEAQQEEQNWTSTEPIQDEETRKRNHSGKE